MSKHRLSPHPDPPAKRVHCTSDNVQPSEPLPSFGELYDEVILCIFSHLSWMDLCKVQSTNKEWARLATDNELWRRLYLLVFGRPRLRGSRGLIGRADGLVVKPLPGRAGMPEYKDWKHMFRISSNWRKGRCKAEVQVYGNPNDGPETSTHRVHILVAGSMTIVASAKPTTRSLVHLTCASRGAQVIECPVSSLDDLVHVTALAVDQSPPIPRHFRLAIFLSSGEYKIYTVQVAQPYTIIESSGYTPTRKSSRTSPIIQAVYHHPLLVTLSQSFSLSLYDVSDNKVSHTQTMSSFTSFPPTSLVLSALSPSLYKLVLAYAVPVYPKHWTVGATELIIAGLADASNAWSARPSSITFNSTFSSGPAVPMTVMATRTVRGIDVPTGWIDVAKFNQMREQWDRKVLRVADAQTDGKWLVLAAGDFPLTDTISNGDSKPQSSTVMTSMHSSSTLQLYRLTFSPPSPSIASSPPKLVFIRNLFGQTGPVAALAVADGRCVSLSVNGSIWVWDLEGGVGAEVAAPDSSRNAEDVRGSIAFDERRIISTDVSGVVVRRFDI